MHARLRPGLTLALVAALAGLLALSAPARPPEGQGLYAVDAATGATQYLGAYIHPAVDAAGGWLYADNSRGSIVRWPLDQIGTPRRLFAGPALGLSGRLWVPVPAPAGGRVAIAANTYQGDEYGGYQRTSLYILDAAGRRERGPIPLFGAQEYINSRLSFDWSPDGTALALSVTESAQRPEGLYIYNVVSNEWLALSGPVGVPRFRPDGQALAVQHATGVNLYAAPRWTAPRALSLPGQEGYGPFAWVDEERLIATTGQVDEQSWVVYTVDGTRAEDFAARPANWWSHGWLERSPAGWAWFASLADGREGLFTTRELVLPDRLVLPLDDLSLAGGVAWDPSGGRLFVGLGE